MTDVNLRFTNELARAVLLASISLQATCLHAEEQRPWAFIAFDKDNGSLEMDMADFNVDGDFVYVWIRTKFVRQVRGVFEFRTRESINCDQSTSAITAIHKIDKTGRIKEALVVDVPQFSHPDENTVDFKKITMACRFFAKFKVNR